METIKILFMAFGILLGLIIVAMVAYALTILILPIIVFAAIFFFIKYKDSIASAFKE